MNKINQLMQRQNSNSFYNVKELEKIGFKKIGKNVLISRLSRIYSPHLMEFGNNIRIDDFAILSGKIILQDFIHMAAYSSITAGDVGVEIGSFSGLSNYSKIFATSDNFTDGYLIGPCVMDELRNVKKIKVELRGHSHIGAHSLVLPGSIFEIGSTLGVMSVNLGRKLNKWGFYYGNPARKIYDLNPSLILQKEKIMLEEWKK